MEKQQRATSSVSKGCFLFNASTRKKRKVLTGSFDKLPGERQQDAKQRHNAYSTCWTAVKERIEGILSRQHQKLFADLLEFVQNAQRQLGALHLDALSGNSDSNSPRPQGRFLPPRLEIPTAALIAGVNMPDHDVLFGQLREKIHKLISPHVVLLRSKDCNTGMKATMKEILRQLMNTAQPPVTADCDEETPSGGPSHSHTQTLPLGSMAVLSSWYTEACQLQCMEDSMCKSSLVGNKVIKRFLNEDVATASQRRKPNDQGSDCATCRHPVVMIIEDFEGFVPQILQDLIASLSPHLPDFPVVLVLGVATTVAAIHRALPRASSSLLCIEQFHTELSTTTLGQVIKEVFLTPTLPFKLGPRAFQFLLWQFFYCNLSITSFARTVQFALMEHFHWQPLSVLCVQGCVAEGTVDQLTHLQCEMVRATLSFQRHVESLEPEKQLLLLENDSSLRVEAKELLVSLDTYHKCFFPFLECLFHLTEGLPGAPMGKKLYELCVLCLEQPITEHANFQSSWALQTVLARDDFSRILSKCIRVLENALANSGCPAAISDALSRLRQFENELQTLDQQYSETPGGGDVSALPSAEETTVQRKMRFQERLRQLSARKKEPSAYEKLRSRLLDYLLELFKAHLVCLHSLPLHEVYYFDHVSSMKKHLAATPRVAIQMALSQPKYYLPSSCSVSEESGLDGNMPDVCIAYQLHLECGRLINLYDWLQSFIAVVEPETAQGSREGEEGTKRSKQEVDPVLHACFIQAVSELQFLGFVKTTQRKTDHVQRLTWGAC